MCVCVCVCVCVWGVYMRVSECARIYLYNGLWLYKYFHED